MAQSRMRRPESERFAFPKLRERFSEDPARFLDREFRDGGRALIEARIRGIDFIPVVRAWKAVERNARVGPGEPRRAVLELLDEREQTLEEIGERPENPGEDTREL